MLDHNASFPVKGFRLAAARLIAFVGLCALAAEEGASAQGGWLRLSSASAPTARGNSAMVYDSTRGRVVLFGGQNISYLADTWEWDGTNWTQLFPVSAPAARCGHAMAYDTVRRRVVLFSGHNETVLFSDTWEWDGVNWHQRSPTARPSGRGYAAMAFDSLQGQVVLFGGADTSGLVNDTWEWDGTTWIQRNPAVSPSARKVTRMVYDSARGRVVLFGGGNHPYYVYGDTWEWDGTNWSQRYPVTSPAPRDGFGLTYDHARSRVVLFGGVNSASFLSDTWEWDGTNWTENSTLNRPININNTLAMAYDTVTGRVVLCVNDVATSRFQTWKYPYYVPATYRPFGSSCTGSAGLPTLQPLGTSLPWLGERFTLLFNNIPPGRPVFVFVGGSNTTWYGQVPLPSDLTGAGMTGCWLLVSADLVGLAQSVVNFVPWNLDICQCSELLGARFYNQGFVYDPTANPMGLTSTNGGEGVVGVR